MTTPTITIDITITVNGERIAPGKAAKFLAALADEPVADPKPPSSETISISSRPPFRPAHPGTPLNEQLEAIERELVSIKEDHDRSSARFGPKGANLFNRVVDIEDALQEFATSVAAALKCISGAPRT